MPRTAIDNAAEFGRHERFGGWALGLLVACSVEPDNGHGKRNDRSDSNKISAQAFARRAGTSHPRVMRFYDAWERAAAKRIVPKASSLTPADVDAYDLPEGYEWRDYYEGGTAAAGSAVGIIERQGSTAVVDKMNTQQRREMLDALVTKEPDLTNRAIARTERTPRPSMDPKEIGEKAGSNMARTLGTDAAVTHLRGAAAELMAAERTRERFGIEHPDQENEALDRIDRYREMYGKGRKRWTNEDQTFLDSVGVEL